MNSLDRISITNVRCFESGHSIELPRITVVIGENSTGKTTLLGCCSAFARLISNQNALEYDPFNIYPFRMGNFDNIIRINYKSFSVGGSANNIDFDFQFCERKGKIFEHNVKVKPSDLDQLTIFQNEITGGFTMTTPPLRLKFLLNISVIHKYLSGLH